MSGARGLTMSAPGPESGDNGATSTDSITSVYYYDDAPGDTTVRPRRPEIPLDWPREQPPVPPPDPRKA